MEVSLKPWNCGMTQEVIRFLHHFHSDHFIIWILVLADSSWICCFCLFSWCLTSAEQWWGCACPWLHSSCLSPLQEYCWCLVCDYNAHLWGPPWHFSHSSSFTTRARVHFCWLLPWTGWPWRKAVREACRGGERETRGIKKQWGGAWEKILCGDWNDRARFLISPRFLIHSSACSSHHVLSFPSFPLMQCNGFHLRDNVWHPWCSLEWAVIDCVFNFDGLAHCWRKPLFTGIVSELLPLQQILSLGFLHVRSQNGEVLPQKTSCTGSTGPCSSTLYVGKLSHGWMVGWITRGPFFHENYCFKSLKFCFMLFWMFHEEQQNTFSVWVINTKPSFGHKHFLFHFPVRIKFHYMGLTCRTRCQYL